MVEVIKVTRLSNIEHDEVIAGRNTHDNNKLVLVRIYTVQWRIMAQHDATRLPVESDWVAINCCRWAT